jgi:copper resistance protein B
MRSATSYARFVFVLCATASCALQGHVLHCQTSETSDVPPATQTADWPPAAEDNMLFKHFWSNQLEGRSGGAGNQFRWEGEGWIGTDMNRLWVKSEGFAGNGEVSDGDQEALYDRPMPRMRYFDAQSGIRVDGDSGPMRVWAALGLEGLAPYFFALEPTLYIRDGGNVAGRIEGSWDLFVTQRWVLQPQAELNFYSKDDAPRKTGSGFSDVDAGIRLRYEVTRKVNPYLGWAYDGKYGGSARYLREAGQAPDKSDFVFGFRVLY